MKECKVCKSPITGTEQFCRVCGAKCVPDMENPSEDIDNNSAGNRQLADNDIHNVSVQQTEDYDKELIVSTSQDLVGYTITKYWGIVSGISLYQFPLRSGNTPLTNSTINNNEEYIKHLEETESTAVNNMINNARVRKADAIIGVNIQKALNNEVVIVSAYGTCVSVVSEEKKEKESEDEQQDTSLFFQDEHCDDLIPDDSSEEDDDICHEKEFLDRIADLADVNEIWNIWKEYGLEDEYPEVDTLLNKRKREAQSFGKLTNTQIEKLKADLYRLLSTDDEIEGANDDSISSEIEFLNAAEEADNVSFIWDIWKELDLFMKYPEANELLANSLREERKFGTFTKAQMNKLKQKLFSIIKV